MHNFSANLLIISSSCEVLLLAILRKEDGSTLRKPDCNTIRSISASIVLRIARHFDDDDDVSLNNSGRFILRNRTFALR
jgi:uncharacterized protein YccT (UPF0319 family)